ncbi:UNKNOWN [Stylonychia lemnae]|uniref:Uncharacterized protein n=1 Tax=Stylonychia lemnae TaxID=5949 RepID=A0A078AHX1_STYLE|nr:UNKNOWN [Stylonychia lemnae]|eukprot:CDW81107.1 UNKNOWN [Stylonychia lemnae]
MAKFNTIKSLVLLGLIFVLIFSDLATPRQSRRDKIKKAKEAQQEGILSQGIRALSDLSIERKLLLDCNMQMNLQETLENMLPPDAKGNRPKLQYAYFCGGATTPAITTPPPNTTANINITKSPNGTKPGTNAIYTLLNIVLLTSIALSAVFI